MSTPETPAERCARIRADRALSAARGHFLRGQLHALHGARAAARHEFRQAMHAALDGGDFALARRAAGRADESRAAPPC